MTESFDIIIVGAGLVGLSFAAAVAPTGLKILLLDNAPAKTDFKLPMIEGRVSAIHARSKEFLTTLQAWDLIKSLRISVYRHMHVWDALGDGVIDFDSAAIHRAALGWIIENDVMVTALHSCLNAFTNVVQRTKVELLGLKHRAPQTIELNTQQGVIRTKLLVGADGAHSWVRTHSDIGLNESDYEHDAIVATVTTEQPHKKTAWQRFLPTGPLAFLPLQDPHRSSIVWSSMREKAAKLIQQPDDVFCQTLATAFDNRLGKIQAIGPRAIFSLHQRHAAHYVKDNIVLIGDAAHTIHPLAGQGVNLGFSDAKELAGVIKTALTKRQPFEKYAILRRYERARKGETQMMLFMMARFKELFASEKQSVIWLRNQGLEKTNQCDFLKQWIMRYAMGQSSLF